LPFSDFVVILRVLGIRAGCCFLEYVGKPMEYIQNRFRSRVGGRVERLGVCTGYDPRLDVASSFRDAVKLKIESFCS
jgi:hypothetical protein